MRLHRLIAICTASAAMMTAQAQPAGFTEDDALQFILRNNSPYEQTPGGEDFYRQDIRNLYSSLAELPWANTVPEREFKHFVLPLRVNNEEITPYRNIIFDQLRDRVKGLSMHDAILEANHWCREQAVYAPSDQRTRGPLGVMNSTLGRCGEESTLAVSALRSIGIPARQVYSTRWAHTDDNHAWVEAWADGKWHFFGACEPEPVLDLGWFNSQAARGMLMVARVYGDYDGPEEVIDRSGNITVINVTSNYTATAPIEVTVVDSNGKAVAGADINFSIYNYAEFVPVATKKSDANGRASLTAGLGDMVVWCSDGEKFGFSVASATKPAVVVLDKDSSYNGVVEFDLVPPPVGCTMPEVTAQQRADNDRRVAADDEVRKERIASFVNNADIDRLFTSPGYDRDALMPYLRAAGGNCNEIASFLLPLSADERGKALRLLNSISAKDITDIPASTLDDCLRYTPDINTPLYNEYVMNPRIEYEPFSETLRRNTRMRLDDNLLNAIRSNPRVLAQWVMANIPVDTVANPSGLRVPLGNLLEKGYTGACDAHSRELLIAGMARACGIPARFDGVTGRTQYADEAGNWHDFIPSVNGNGSATGTLHLKYDAGSSPTGPRYYSHFAIANIDNGRLKQLAHKDFATVDEVNEVDRSTNCGQYMLVTGQRLANGTVLARVAIATVEPDKTTELPLQVRRDDSEVQVIGSFNSENIYYDDATGTDKSLLSTTGRGYYVLGLINPSHEPSAHALNDISVEREGLSLWGKKIMLLLPGRDGLNRFDRSLFGNLPENAVLGADRDGAMAAEVIASLGLQADERPIFIIADTFNRIVFVEQGYSIGLGRKLLETVHRLQE